MDSLHRPASVVPVAIVEGSWDSDCGCHAPCSDDGKWFTEGCCLAYFCHACWPCLLVKIGDRVGFHPFGPCECNRRTFSGRQNTLVILCIVVFFGSYLHTFIKALHGQFPWDHRIHHHLHHHLHLLHSKQRVLQSCFLVLLGIIVGILRGRVRAIFRIRTECGLGDGRNGEGCTEDILYSTCCTPCAIAQMVEQVDLEGGQVLGRGCMGPCAPVPVIATRSSDSEQVVREDSAHSEDVPPTAASRLLV